MITAGFLDELMNVSLLDKAVKVTWGNECGDPECCGERTVSLEFDMTREEFMELDLAGINRAEDSTGVFISGGELLNDASCSV